MELVSSLVHSLVSKLFCQSVSQYHFWMGLGGGVNAVEKRKSLSNAWNPSSSCNMPDYIYRKASPARGSAAAVTTNSALGTILILHFFSVSYHAMVQQTKGQLVCFLSYHTAT